MTLEVASIEGAVERATEENIAELGAREPAAQLWGRLGPLAFGEIGG